MARSTSRARVVEQVPEVAGAGQRVGHRQPPGLLVLERRSPTAVPAVARPAPRRRRRAAASNGGRALAAAERRARRRCGAPPRRGTASAGRRGRPAADGGVTRDRVRAAQPGQVVEQRAVSGGVAAARAAGPLLEACGCRRAARSPTSASAAARAASTHGLEQAVEVVGAAERLAEPPERLRQRTPARLQLLGVLPASRAAIASNAAASSPTSPPVGRPRRRRRRPGPSRSPWRSRPATRREQPSSGRVSRVGDDGEQHRAHRDACQPPRGRRARQPGRRRGPGHEVVGRRRRPPDAPGSARRRRRRPHPAPDRVARGSRASGSRGDAEHRPGAARRRRAATAGAEPEAARPAPPSEAASSSGATATTRATSPPAASVTGTARPAAAEAGGGGSPRAQEREDAQRRAGRRAAGPAAASGPAARP